MSEVSHNFAWTTAWAMVLFAFFVVAYDLWIGQSGGPDATISSRLLVLGQTYPVLTFGLGILVGHCFWPMKQ